MSSKQQFQLFRFILALGISLGISMLIIFLVSKEPWTAISYLLLGPFGSMRHFLSIFAQATPLIFTGLALSLCFKSGNFSMITDALPPASLGDFAFGGSDGRHYRKPACIGEAVF